jgi:hypothetical protein
VGVGCRKAGEVSLDSSREVDGRTTYSEVCLSLNEKFFFRNVSKVKVLASLSHDYMITS